MSKTITYSKNVFLPLTHVCTNACGYCGFKEPVKDGCIMDPSTVKQILHHGAQTGCTEALFTFGEMPEQEPGFTAHLAKLGYHSILEYAYDMGKYAISCGLLPHTNAGIVSEETLKNLRTVNASMGLMLETTANIKAHEYSPGKNPKTRINLIESAGKLKIPFTTGLLLGIGETRNDRIESLEIIKDIYLRYRHIQEIIIQNFCPKLGTKMANVPGASFETLKDTLELAVEILPSEIAIQIPPNLVTELRNLLDWGVDDLGGISPITIDYVNPEHPWPEIENLKRLTEIQGYSLKERLCIYKKYCTREWVDSSVYPVVSALADKIYQ